MEKRLQRKEIDKVIAGVASGLAEYLDLDVTIVRIIFVLMAIFGFSGVLIYIVLWIVLPVKPLFFNAPGSSYEANYQTYKQDLFVNTAPTSTVFPETKKSGNGRVLAGLVLVCIGLFFLLEEFDFIPHWFELYKLWPLVFVFLGILILSNSKKKKSWRPEEDKQEPETVWEKKANEPDLNSDQPQN